MELDDYLKLDYTITLRRDEDGDWVVRVQELKGCTAHGPTQGDALERLEEAKRDWIESALEHNLSIPTPTAEEPLPSGKWLQRAPRKLQKDLKTLADAEGVSFNHMIVMILSRYVGAALDRVGANLDRYTVAPQDHEHRQGIGGWSAAGTIWVGRLEMDSPRSFRVLRSLCRKLPEHIRLDPREMEEEDFDAHAGKR